MNSTLRRRRRRESNRIKLFATLLIAAVILLYILNVAFGLNNIKGDVDAAGKGYITVTVHNEDTLWSIADTYMNDAYYSHETFIDEVVEINDLDGSRIYAGEQIMIPVIADSNL